jgi:hypothetical protein
MAWPPRTPSIPASCRDLDHNDVVATFIACRANVSDAAKRLHVPSADLRRLVVALPELLAAAFEKEERRLDKAEAILDRELNSDDPRYSAAAAFFVLRNAKRAVARGWRQPDVEVAVEASGPPVRCRFLWGDGSRVAMIDYPAGTVIPRTLEIEHHDPRRARVVSDEELARERASAQACGIVGPSGRHSCSIVCPAGRRQSDAENVRLNARNAP